MIGLALEEYKALRSEIVSWQQTQAALLGLAFTVSAGSAPSLLASKETARRPWRFHSSCRD